MTIETPEPAESEERAFVVITQVQHRVTAPTEADAVSQVLAAAGIADGKVNSVQVIAQDQF